MEREVFSARLQQHTITYIVSVSIFAFSYKYRWQRRFVPSIDTLIISMVLRPYVILHFCADAVQLCRRDKTVQPMLAQSCTT